MDIETSLQATEAVVALNGRLDTKTAPALEEALEQLPEDITSLTLDLERLDYISSAGLRVLQVIRKRLQGKGGGLKLRHVGPMVMEVLDATGFSSVLNIEAS